MALDPDIPLGQPFSTATHRRIFRKPSGQVAYYPTTIERGTQGGAIGRFLGALGEGPRLPSGPPPGQSNADYLRSLGANDFAWAGFGGGGLFRRPPRRLDLVIQDFARRPATNYSSISGPRSFLDPHLTRDTLRRQQIEAHGRLYGARQAERSTMQVELSRSLSSYDRSMARLVRFAREVDPTAMNLQAIAERRAGAGLAGGSYAPRGLTPGYARENDRIFALENLYMRLLREMIGVREPFR